jgi:hypothetical protein
VKNRAQLDFVSPLVYAGRRCGFLEVVAVVAVGFVEFVNIHGAVVASIVMVGVARVASRKQVSSFGLVGSSLALWPFAVEY